MKRPQQVPGKKVVVTLPTGAPTPPYIDARVPKTALSVSEAYGAGIEARRMQSSLPKVNMPVAGGPGPSIPRLDRPPRQGGYTMQQHAAMEREVPAAPVQPKEGGSFVETPIRQQAHQPALNIQPMDTLPQEAATDPGFRGGNGAMFAVNQSPQLVLKYGVIRGKRIIPPQELVAGSGSKISQTTREDIRQIQELQSQQVKKVAVDTTPATATHAIVPEQTTPLSDDEKKSMEKILSNMDEFQFDAWRRAMMKDILNDPKQKEIIEARLEELDVGDLITDQFIVQRVPILPGKFEVTFKTQDGETDLALKRLIMEDANSIGEVTERYYLDRFSFMSTAASTYAINNTPLLDHRDENGDFNDELFRKKFNWMLKLPLHMLASIGLNSMWFEMRVRALFKAEKLGNG
jgi:hypothetical protein